MTNVSIGSKPYTNGSDFDCIICFDKIQLKDSPKQYVTVLACTRKHIYHHECFNEWLKRPSVKNRNCLICQAALSPLISINPESDLFRLSSACHLNVQNEVKQLLQNNKELANMPGVDPTSSVIRSFLSIALRANSQEAAVALINDGLGLDVNSPLKYGPKPEEFKYPLHLAAEHGDVKVVSALLNNGAEVDILMVTSHRYIRAREITGLYKEDTPIGLAVKHGHLPVVKHLIAAGSKAALCLYNYGKYGENPSLLQLAIKYNQVEIVRYLLSEELKKQKHMDTPLYRYIVFEESCSLLLSTAALDNRVAIVELLLAVCNTERVRSELFLYPLWFAVQFGNQEVVEVMFKSGFYNQISNYGESLREFAKKHNQQEIVQLIDQYGANYSVPFIGKVCGHIQWVLRIAFTGEFPSPK